MNSSSGIRGILSACVLILLLSAGSLAAQGSVPAAPVHDGRCGGSPASGGPGYDLAADGSGGYTGTNATQRFRIIITPDGVRLGASDPAASPWTWGLSLARHGRRGDLREEADAWPLVTGDRAEWARGTLMEWLVNGPKGLQHGLDLPAGTDPGLLEFEFTLRGSLWPKVSLDRQSVLFLDVSGRPVIAYRELRGVDAGGQEISGHWQTIPGEAGSPPSLRLTIDATDLAAPLLIRGSIVAVKGNRGTAGADTASLPEGILAAPANDLCGGAEVIPGGGPFPYVSGTYDITDATETGDPPAPSCQQLVSRSVWFKFVPAATGYYSFSLCSDAPTLTTVEDTVLAIYSAAGSCTGFSELAGGCDDDSCSVGELQSVLSSLRLIAGTTYYIVAWQYDVTPPPPGSSTIQLRVTQDSAPPAAPPNDQCNGAAVIPASGPFPYLTATVADITGATTIGDPPAPSCQNVVSRSIWYSFTPASTASYIFSLCAESPTATTVDDTVMAVYTGNGPCSGLAELPGACNDDYGCAVEPQQSEIFGVTLTAGTTYYIVIWKSDVTPPAAGNTAVQMRVTQALAPGNDTCGAAIPIGLDTPIIGTTSGALDNYELPSGSACFTGIGQIQPPDIAAGEEVVYRFTAPKAASYSFRSAGYSAGNSVLYVSSDCPAGAPPANIAGCLGAANRNVSAPGSEEVKCLSLAADQTVYVYADDASLSAGGTFTLEVNECVNETEANGSTATAGSLACGIEGSTPTFDTDFFALGTPDAGSRVFALVDAIAANATNYDLRVTNTADTLEYDNRDNDIAFGDLAPDIAGSQLSGAASYLRVNYNLGSVAVEPYRLYATIQRPSVGATPEVEPNNSIASATAGVNLYFSGALSSASDVDIFSFPALGGELVQVGLDLDPTRDNTPFDGKLSLLDVSGTTLLVVNDTNGTSNTTPGTGSLSALNPNSPAEGLVYRIRSSGTYYAKVEYSAGTAGDYLVSISRNCRIGPPTDVGVSQTDAPDPVQPGANVTYTVTVGNSGGQAVTLLSLRDDLPPGSTFVSATPSQGSCSGSGPVSCALGTLAAAGTATVQIVVTAPGSPGSMTNSAAASSAVIDPNPANNAASQTTTVGNPDSDGDGVPDAADCAPANPAAWAVPGEATAVIFASGADTSTLQWSAPASPGGTVVSYDLLRSGTANGFAGGTCVATDITATSASDAAVPAGAFFYLVRSENVCGGTLGSDSSGTPRAGISCP